MSIRNQMNVLCMIAHPDDIELMAGGTIAKWINEGHNVRVLTFSNGVWTSPENRIMRKTKEALSEEKMAASYLGYKVENLQFPAMELSFNDEMVRLTLDRIKKFKIDTILCPWEKDIHHDHEVIARVALAAGRRVERILMGQINYYLREFFMPNLFVDITSTWKNKIKALGHFKSQWERQGKDWYEFLDVTTRYYGKICGVKRAEGFISRKFLI
jgi:LmbE family N-acetylglucosaminyl deacetylase